MTRHGKAPAQSTGERSSSPRIADSVTVGTTQQSGESQGEESTFARETVGQIEALIESFRTGKDTKTQTIFKIGQILAAEQIGDEQSKFDSLERYASTLNSIETLSTESAKHGQRFVNPVLGKRKEVINDGDRRHETVDRSITGARNPIDLDDFIEGLSNKSVDDHGNDESGGDSSSDESGNDEPNNQGKSNKKQRVYESQMPWYDNEQRIRNIWKNPN